MSAKKPTILLVEDDRLISRAYEIGMKHEGFDMLVAYDGSEAMAILKEKQPDVILLDLIMPNKNGFDVLTELKADERLKAIPVIVLSNLGQDADIVRGKELGAVDYLIKSDLSISDVVLKVHTYLDRKK
ncbi:MAG TPA: response regulator [Patescibacteria group bacterium]|nr:response regulator [Patescibacteria group bacterium]